MFFIKLTLLLISLVAVLFTAFPLSSLSAQVHSSNFYLYSIQFDYQNINFTNLYSNYTYEPFQEPYDPANSRLKRFYRLGYFGTASSNGDPESFEIVPVDYTVAEFQKDYLTRVYNPQLEKVFVDENYNPLNVNARKPVLQDGVNKRYLASFVMMLLSAAFIGISLLLLIFTCLPFGVKFKTIPKINVLLCILGFVLLLVSAALITELNRSIISRYNDTYNILGIRASFGNGYFYIFLWIAVGIEFALSILLILEAVFTRKRIKSTV